MSWAEDEGIDGYDVSNEIYEMEQRMEGYIHFNQKGERVDIRTIDERYAKNLFGWYVKLPFFFDDMLESPFMKCLEAKTRIELVE